MKAVHLLIFAAASSIVGCRRGGGEDGAAPSGLVERCAGTYTCIAGSKTGTLVLHGDATGMCLAGPSASQAAHRAVVNTDGTITVPDGSTLTWHGDASLFQLCSGSNCAKCVDMTEKSGGPGTKGTGPARSRGSLATGRGVLAHCQGLGFTHSSGFSRRTSEDECAGWGLRGKEVSRERAWPAHLRCPGEAS